MNFLLILIISLFTEANNQYAEGNYSDAAIIYKQIIAESTITDISYPLSDVYYNLGNAYFKQGELAQSILAYERCLRLQPGHKDAKHNLLFAQSRIIDNIQDTHAFFLSNWFKSVRNALSQRTWTILSVSLFNLMLLLFFVFAFSQTIWLRKSAFYIALTALLFSGISLANATSLHKRDTLRAEAIITQGIVNAKSSPDRSGNDLFTLHEGSKITITETIADWCCIQVGNNIGWIPIAHLERI
jgi:tetratricopeptide (TPR) repeat protein